MAENWLAEHFPIGDSFAKAMDREVKVSFGELKQKVSFFKQKDLTMFPQHRHHLHFGGRWEEGTSCYFAATGNNFEAETVIRKCFHLEIISSCSLSSRREGEEQRSTWVSCPGQGCQVPQKKQRQSEHPTNSTITSRSWGPLRSYSWCTQQSYR